MSAQNSNGRRHSDTPTREEEPTTGPFDRCFTVDQAAQVLGTSPATFRRLLHNGQIAYQRVSARRTVIRESALRAYLDSVTVGANPHLK